MINGCVLGIVTPSPFHAFYQPLLCSQSPVYGEGLGTRGGGASHSTQPQLVTHASLSVYGRPKYAGPQDTVLPDISWAGSWGSKGRLSDDRGFSMGSTSSLPKLSHGRIPQLCPSGISATPRGKWQPDCEGRWAVPSTGCVNLCVFFSPGEEATGRTEREGFPESATSFWVEQDGKGTENRDGSMPGFPRRTVHACVLCVWIVHSHRNTPQNFLW